MQKIPHSKAVPSGPIQFSLDRLLASGCVPHSVRRRFAKLETQVQKSLAWGSLGK